MGLLDVIYLDIITEFLLLLFFFTNKITKSTLRLKSCACISLFSTIIPLFVHSQDFFVFIDLVISLIVAFLMLQEKCYEKIVSFLLVYIFTSLLYQVLILIFDLIFMLPIFVGMSTEKGEHIAQLCLILLIIIALFIKSKVHYYFNLTFINKIFLCIYSGIMCAILTIFEINKSFIQTDILNLIALLCIASTGIIFSYIISSSAQNLNLENLHKQKEYITMLKSYYQKAKENNMEIRKLKHDIRNHICILNNLIENGDMEQAVSYMEDITYHVSDKTASFPDTGNVLVNAILLQKKIAYPHIDLNFKGVIENTIYMDDYDFCTILNNLLDNALEYTDKNGLKTIVLRIYQENSTLLIHIIQDLIEPLNTSAFTKTSKTDKKHHGYGLIIAKETINRYHGTLEYSHENLQLITKVQIWLPL